MRVAVTVADPVDFEGRVLAQALIAGPNYYRDEIRTTAVTTTIVTAGHYQA